MITLFWLLTNVLFLLLDFVLKPVIFLQICDGRRDSDIKNRRRDADDDESPQFTVYLLIILTAVFYLIVNWNLVLCRLYAITFLSLPLSFRNVTRLLSNSTFLSSFMLDRLKN